MEKEIAEIAEELGSIQRPLIVLGPDLTVVWVNALYERLFRIDHGDLIGANPRLVQVSLTPFGRTGPRAGSSEDVTHFRTQLVLLGTAGGPPWWPGTERAGDVRRCCLTL